MTLKELMSKYEKCEPSNGEEFAREVFGCLGFSDIGEYRDNDPMRSLVDGWCRSGIFKKDDSHFYIHFHVGDFEGCYFGDVFTRLRRVEYNHQDAGVPSKLLFMI